MVSKLLLLTVLSGLNCDKDAVLIACRHSQKLIDEECVVVSSVRIFSFNLLELVYAEVAKHKRGFCQGRLKVLSTLPLTDD